MLKFYELDSENRIVITSDRGRITAGGIIGNQFDFPDGFDFSRQHFYKIIDEKLVEDAEAITAELSAQIRTKRDILLRQCDFTVLPDSPYTEEQRSAWINYRQVLRDIPQQLGFPFNVVFPDKPE